MMTPEKIKEINKLCPYDEGIFIEPYGFPSHLKGVPLIYMRWVTGGMKGGGYHEDAVAHPYTSDDPEAKFEALDIVLKELKPNISYLQYKEVEKMVQESTNNAEYWDYYGNYDEYSIKYIVLSELEAYLQTI